MEQNKNSDQKSRCFYLQFIGQSGRSFVAITRVYPILNCRCGERGIRTLDTLRYTRFPSARHRPLGDLSVIVN